MGDVKVWGVELSSLRVPIYALMPLLSAGECRQASAFGSAAERRRYVVARAALRYLLGRALNVAPRALQLRELARGKPALDRARPGPDLRFNLTHTDDYALIALAEGRHVGIDAERLRPIADAVRVARRFFSEREQLALQELPCAARSQAFLALWTRKEAYLKALGDGLYRPLDDFSCEPWAERWRVVRRTQDADDLWTLLELRALPGHVAHVAAQGASWSLDWRGLLRASELLG